MWRRFRLYWLNLAIAFLDQTANALLGGSPDETLSSRMGRLKDDPATGKIRRGVSQWVCRGLDGLEAGHCDRAEAGELERPHREDAAGEHRTPLTADELAILSRLRERRKAKER